MLKSIQVSTDTLTASNMIFVIYYLRTGRHVHWDVRGGSCEAGQLASWPSPLVMKNHFLPYPPRHEKSLFGQPFPPSAHGIICEQPLNQQFEFIFRCTLVSVVALAPAPAPAEVGVSHPRDSPESLRGVGLGSEVDGAKEVGGCLA